MNEKMGRKNPAVVVFVLLTGMASTGSAQQFESYTQKVTGEPWSIEMVAVSGGSFSMGAAADSERPESEKPAHPVSVDDFWMSKFEITWTQYDTFLTGDFAASRFKDEAVLKEMEIDAVSSATPPWEDMSFGMGRGDHPAVNMTQYAALMFARWLSSTTGVFYRLPTEAEWEYACKNGETETLTPLQEAAWFAANTSDKYEETGTRQANGLGIHDMLGNVSEWVMDQYSEDFYAASPTDNPWNIPTELYPRVIRGGAWSDSEDRLTCTARTPSTTEWKDFDPQIPKSGWWHTSAPFVGFRLVRPRVQPSRDEIGKYWLEAVPDFGID